MRSSKHHISCSQGSEILVPNAVDITLWTLEGPERGRRPVMAMDGHVHHGRILLEDLLGAIAMMHIPIKNQDTLSTGSLQAIQ